MTPYQLANTSELSQQTALFCYASKAMLWGFKDAMRHEAYTIGFRGTGLAVPELAFFHSIPNGVRSGDLKSRLIEGGRLRASGVKAGVLDTFWPLPRGGFHGLYLEMKTHKGELSKEQITFGNYAKDKGYEVKLCRSWIEAAQVLETYYLLGG